MADLKYQPARHDHEAFLEKARNRPGFQEAYEALDVEYRLAGGYSIWNPLSFASGRLWAAVLRRFLSSD